VVLLPNTDGLPSSITVTNSAGSQVIDHAYQAVRVGSASIAPSQPFPMDEPEVQRVFGSLLDALPTAERVFTLYFGEDSEMLVAESQAQIPAIFEAIRQQHSTAITLIGHTDTTADRQYNYKLGLRRANRVAEILRAQGINNDDVFIDSHGDTDLAVKTGPGVAERLNRRVEVTVR